MGQPADAYGIGHSSYWFQSTSQGTCRLVLGSYLAQSTDFIAFENTRLQLDNSNGNRSLQTSEAQFENQAQSTSLFRGTDCIRVWNFAISTDIIGPLKSDTKSSEPLVTVLDVNQI